MLYLNSTLRYTEVLTPQGVPIMDTLKYTKYRYLKGNQSIPQKYWYIPQGTPKSYKCGRHWFPTILYLGTKETFLKMFIMPDILVKVCEDPGTSDIAEMTKHTYFVSSTLQKNSKEYHTQQENNL